MKEISGPSGFTISFIQHLKKLIPILYKIFQKIKEDHISVSFMKLASLNPAYIKWKIHMKKQNLAKDVMLV